VELLINRHSRTLLGWFDSILVNVESCASRTFFWKQMKSLFQWMRTYCPHAVRLSQPLREYTFHQRWYVTLHFRIWDTWPTEVQAHKFWNGTVALVTRLLIGDKSTDFYSGLSLENSNFGPHCRSAKGTIVEMVYLYKPCCHAGNSTPKKEMIWELLKERNLLLHFHSEQKNFSRSLACTAVTVLTTEAII